MDGVGKWARRKSRIVDKVNGSGGEETNGGEESNERGAGENVVKGGWRKDLVDFENLNSVVEEEEEWEESEELERWELADGRIGRFKDENNRLNEEIEANELGTREMDIV